MPRKFSLNVIGKNKSKKEDEHRPLMASSQPMYVAGNETNLSGSGRKISSSSQPPLPRSASSISGLSNGSGGGYGDPFDTPMIKIRAGMIPNSPGSSKSVPAIMDIDFDSVPFQFFSRESDNWKEAFIQSIIIGLICLICPGFILFCIFFGSHTYNTRYKVNAKEEEIKREFWVFMILLGITLTKDLIVIALVLQSYFETEASTYIVGYSPTVFFWFLILFAFPLTVFYFADARYEFGFDGSDKKRIIAALSNYFISSKTKRTQAHKVTEQDKYFNENYEQLSSIKSSNDEFIFMWKSTSKKMITAASVLSVATCIMHALIPMFLQLLYFETHTHQRVVNFTMPFNRMHSTRNGTVSYPVWNVTNVRVEEHHSGREVIGVIAISTLNSFIVSLLASPYFVYVILWKLAILKEWKRFNETESDSRRTLIAAGPQGIAMWWKVRQTLKLFSSSSICMSVWIGKIACIVTMLLVVALSASIFMKAIDLESVVQPHVLVPLIIDNMLLYVASLVIGTLTIIIAKEKNNSGWIIELKRLNVSYELGQLMNLEQEAVENEPGIKVKVRVQRGCLMLLQELSATMESLERNTSTSKSTIACFVIATLAFLPSTMIGFRYLSS